MKSDMTITDLKNYLNKKFKERKFLDALYSELASIIADPEIIKNLSSDELCDLIIDHRLLAKLTKLEDAPGENPIRLMKKNGEEIDDEDFKGDDKDRSVEKAWLNVFLEEINDLDYFMGEGEEEGREIFENKDLRVGISFNGERLVSDSSVLKKNIRFLQNFKFQLNKGPRNFTSLELLKVTSPLRFTIYLEDINTKKKTIKSIKDIEWRYILAKRKLELKIQMPSIDNKTDMVGTLRVELVYGGKPRVPQTIQEAKLEEELKLQKKDITKKIAHFYEFAQDWWIEYKNLNPYFATRSIKIYSENIFGELNPSPYFLRKLQCRGITSPEEALRFVYLIPFDNKPLTREKIWLDTDSFLTEGRGGAIEHSLLLCSLLLGFGYDAYVCIGRSSDGPHAWVFTRDEEPRGKTYIKKWRMWEGLIGKILDVNDYKVKFLYSKVSCVFNDQKFYANLQKTEDVHKVDFTFEDSKLWKQMDLKQYLPPRPKFKLQMIPTPATNIFNEEEKLENLLMLKFASYRKEKQLETKFDKELNHILSMILTKYELSRTMMIKLDGSEFMQRIKNHIDENCTFKSFPIEFRHKNIEDIYSAIIGQPKGEEVIMSHGDQARMAVRCKIVQFPEGIFALWVVVGVYYINI